MGDDLVRIGVDAIVYVLRNVHIGYFIGSLIGYAIVGALKESRIFHRGVPMKNYIYLVFTAHRDAAGRLAIDQYDSVFQETRVESQEATLRRVRALVDQGYVVTSGPTPNESGGCSYVLEHPDGRVGHASFESWSI